MTESNAKCIRISPDLHTDLKVRAAQAGAPLGAYVASKLGFEDPPLGAKNWLGAVHRALVALPEQLRRVIAIETLSSKITLTATGKDGRTSPLQIHLRANNAAMAFPCPEGGPKNSAATPRLELLGMSDGQLVRTGLAWYLRKPSLRHFAREVRDQLLWRLQNVGLIERVPEPVDDEGRYFLVPEFKSWRYVDSGEPVLVSDDLSDMVLRVDELTARI